MGEDFSQSKRQIPKYLTEILKGPRKLESCSDKLEEAVTHLNNRNREHNQGNGEQSKYKRLGEKGYSCILFNQYQKQGKA